MGRRVTCSVFDWHRTAERAVAVTDEMRSLQKTGGSEVPRESPGPRRKYAPPTPHERGASPLWARVLKNPSVCERVKLPCFNPLGRGIIAVERHVWGRGTWAHPSRWLKNEKIAPSETSEVKHFFPFFPNSSITLSFPELWFLTIIMQSYVKR